MSKYSGITSAANNWIFTSEAARLLGVTNRRIEQLAATGRVRWRRQNGLRRGWMVIYRPDLPSKIERLVINGRTYARWIFPPDKLRKAIRFDSDVELRSKKPFGPVENEENFFVEETTEDYELGQAGEWFESERRERKKHPSPSEDAARKSRRAAEIAALINEGYRALRRETKTSDLAGPPRCLVGVGESRTAINKRKVVIEKQRWHYIRYAGDPAERVERIASIGRAKNATTKRVTRSSDFAFNATKTRHEATQLIEAPIDRQRK